MKKKLSASSRPEKLIRMSAEDVRRKEQTPEFKQELARIARMKDSEIDYSDIPPMTKEQLASMFRGRDRRKVSVHVRLDPDILTWLKSKGEGHLTRINDILANVMKLEQKHGAQR